MAELNKNTGFAPEAKSKGASLKQKLILPGESITTEEEYVPGRNTFAENGMVKSKIMGIAEFDDEKKTVSMKGKSIRKIVTGDVIVGKVMLVKESTVVLEIVSAENNKKITGVKTAQLPVRNVSTEYVSDLKKMMKIGDLVRARITMASPLAIDVATNEKGLGVIKAYCSNCRKEMQYSNEKLMCLNCGSVEERKWFEAEQKPREFRPRDDSFRPREDGRERRPHFGERREGGFDRERPHFSGHGRNFDQHRGGGEGTSEPFGEHTHRGSPRGKEFHGQGQGFMGHQNKPQRRW